jgi:hypothetical protein
MTYREELTTMYSTTCSVCGAGLNGRKHETYRAAINLAGSVVYENVCNCCRDWAYTLSKLRLGYNYRVFNELGYQGTKTYTQLATYYE